MDVCKQPMCGPSWTCSLPTTMQHDQQQIRGSGTAVVVLQSYASPTLPVGPWPRCAPAHLVIVIKTSDLTAFQRDTLHKRLHFPCCHRAIESHAEGAGGLLRLWEAAVFG